MKRYFGAYANFETPSKEDAASLLSADNMVGDVYDIDIVYDPETSATRAWLVSRFDERIGFFDPDVSRKINLARADGLECKGILSFLAFTNHPGDGHYWGSAAVICYPTAHAQEFTVFIDAVSKKIGDDVRPRIDFDGEAVDKVIESGGTWMPTQTITLPSDEKGMAILKRRRRMTDKLIEQGRARNKGCYVASWVCLLAVVALIVFGLKSCFGW